MFILTILGLLSATAVAGTIVSISRDGYRRVPDRQSRRR